MKTKHRWEMRNGICMTAVSVLIAVACFGPDEYITYLIGLTLIPILLGIYCSCVCAKIERYQNLLYARRYEKARERFRQSMREFNQQSHQLNKLLDELPTRTDTRN